VDVGYERSVLVRFGSVPFVRIVGLFDCGLAQSHVAPWRCSLCLFYFVVALPPDVLVAMNGWVAGVV